MRNTTIGLFMKNDVARDISYATSSNSLMGQLFIRSIENITGRIGLIKRAKDYEIEVAKGRNFWEVIVERYNIKMNLINGSLEDIPKKGPVVIVSNHPFGILDGLLLGYILSKTRNDFKIIANRVFRKAKDLDEVVLPISFEENREGNLQNINTRNEAIRFLKGGGIVGIFPGGTVATSAKLFSRPLDPFWKRFTSKLILKSGATVVPIFFGGSNSRLFQIASHMSYNLRMALLIREFGRKVDRKVDVAIGKKIGSKYLQKYSKDLDGMMEYLRVQSYLLSNDPNQTFENGLFLG
jgi:putative hemolysin